MRRRSPSYSPPRRGYGGRGRSPPRVRYGGHKDAPCGLLVRNISKSSRPEDIRGLFESFGRVRDVYLPKDYYSGEPRGFGFVQYTDPADAAEAKKCMDRQLLNGRQITVVFAEENRKRPEEMRMKERSRGRMSYGGGRRSPYRGYSASRSPPRYRSPSPRDGRYSRSNDGSSRRGRYDSVSPPPRGRGRGSRSPDPPKRGRDYSPDDERAMSPVKGMEDKKRGRQHSISPERPYSPRKEGYPKSPSGKPNYQRSQSPVPPTHNYSRSPEKDSRRSRSKSWRESRSPSSRSPPPRRQRHASLSRSPRSRSPPPRRQRHSGRPNSRESGDPAEKSPRGHSRSPSR